MAKLKMTDAAVQRASAAPGERVDYSDAHRDRQRGLVLRVNGGLDDQKRPIVTSRTWCVLCRVSGNPNLRRFVIGDYPTYSLAEARELAAEIVKKARRGIDPLKERKKVEIEAEIAGKDTIAALVEKFMGDMAKRPKKKGGMRSARYIEETQRNFDNHVLPRWASKNVREITRRDVNDLLDAIADEGTDVRGKDGAKHHVTGGRIAANRVLSTVCAFFNWALDKGIIEATPAARVAKRGEETARERALSDDEIRLIWPQAKALGYPFGPFFCMALATGQRRDEVAGMRWADIDDKAMIWAIPKEFTKAKREHVVPLSALALDLLADAKEAGRALAKAHADAAKLARIPEIGPYVFSARRDRPISGYSKAKAALDEMIGEAVNEAGRAPIEHWTIHDLRRTCATGMAALGTDRFVIGRVLNHADGSITGRYDKYGYLAEKRAALEAWAEHLAGLTKPRAVDDAEARGAA